MRALAAAAGILASTVLVLAVPVPETKPSDKKVPPVSSSEAANYSRTMKAVARHISENYAREIAQEKLLAAALRRLYDTAGTPLPPHLHGDLEKILVGGDADGELYKSRLALGAPPVLEGDQATRVSLEAMIELLDPFSAFHSIRSASASRLKSEPARDLCWCAQSCSRVRPRRRAYCRAISFWRSTARARLSCRRPRPCFAPTRWPAAAP
jgi:hypothetical protein